ncbi:hypothetical protein [Mastigocoleus sp. MO_188.B34]|uniref:hypothetical protein n=1 Tax=Mastigocoleus sp. MO_188.B34 TaxID=3036635 RepID=UPI0026075891|nr:hypothetical protein [Mastigocoleus sp. MO_188.B34]MDJ0694603.1 hypothetical protein [Mastigocoleus sp. MO_188.B34]
MFALLILGDEKSDVQNPSNADLILQVVIYYPYDGSELDSLGFYSEALSFVDAMKLFNYEAIAPHNHHLMKSTGNESFAQ